MSIINKKGNRYHYTGDIASKEIRRAYGQFIIIYEIVKQIPPGCVATYGQVAEVAGNRKMARAVGNALHRNPDPDHIPCHRVVNAKGELAEHFAFGGAEGQAKRLTAEGVEVKDGRVDLMKFGWRNEEGDGK